MKIEDIEGIGPAYGAKLAEMGILTTDDLLASGGTRAGRERIAEATGLSHALVLEWVNNADLMRIPGVGTQYSDLLEAAGVDSPAELAHRNAANLAQTFQEVVAARPGPCDGSPRSRRSRAGSRPPRRFRGPSSTESPRATNGRDAGRLRLASDTGLTGSGVPGPSTRHQALVGA